MPLGLHDPSTLMNGFWCLFAAMAPQQLIVKLTAMLWLALTDLLVSSWPCLASALVNQAALAQLQFEAPN